MRIYTQRAASSGPVGSILDDGGEPYAVTFEGNPLAIEPEELPEPLRGGRVVLYSGTLGTEALYEKHPLTWTEKGWNRFGGVCAALFRREVTAMFEPHARHVLSDPYACLKYISEFVDRPGARHFELVLSPVGMLEVSMLDDAAEHLDRIIRGLADRSAALKLTNLRRDGDDLVPCPVHEGVLDPELLSKIVMRHVPTWQPLILLEEQIDAQREAIRPLEDYT
jgi:hypothetical protein